VSTAIAILAAGRGSRLGGEASKPLLEWRGRPLVAWAVDAALRSSLRPVLVVVGYRGDEVRAALDGREVTVVDNPEWEEGIAASLRAALTVLAPMDDVDAVAIGLADQPLIDPEVYEALTGLGGEIVVPHYGGQPGNPVKLTRSLWPEAMALRGDAGARVLMRDRDVLVADCTGRGSPADVDTLEDLERLQQEDQ
jgi:molybdenum cofactor cytidylyltransferase/nicotine blue oxidoreductase